MSKRPRFKLFYVMFWDFFKQRRNKQRRQRLHHAKSWNNNAADSVCVPSLKQWIENCSPCLYFSFLLIWNTWRESTLNKELCGISMRDWEVENKTTESTVEWEKSSKERKCCTENCTFLINWKCFNLQN